MSVCLRRCRCRCCCCLCPGISRCLPVLTVCRFITPPARLGHVFETSRLELWARQAGLSWAVTEGVGTWPVVTKSLSNAWVQRLLSVIRASSFDNYIRTYIPTFIHSFTHSLIHSFIHSFIHVFTSFGQRVRKVAAQMQLITVKQNRKSSKPRKGSSGNSLLGMIHAQVHRPLVAEQGRKSTRAERRVSQNSRAAKQSENSHSQGSPKQARQAKPVQVDCGSLPIAKGEYKRHIIEGPFQEGKLGKIVADHSGVSRLHPAAGPTHKSVQSADGRALGNWIAATSRASSKRPASRNVWTGGDSSDGEGTSHSTRSPP